MTQCFKIRAEVTDQQQALVRPERLLNGTWKSRRGKLFFEASEDGPGFCKHPRVPSAGNPKIEGEIAPGWRSLCRYWWSVNSLMTSCNNNNHDYNSSAVKSTSTMISPSLSAPSCSTPRLARIGNDLMGFIFSVVVAERAKPFTQPLNPSLAECPYRRSAIRTLAGKRCRSRGGDPSSGRIISPFHRSNPHLEHVRRSDKFRTAVGVRTRISSRIPQTPAPTP